MSLIIQNPNPLSNLNPEIHSVESMRERKKQMKWVERKKEGPKAEVK